AIPCKRVGLAVVGLEVPHAHVHLVPLQGIEDINFTKERVLFSDAQLAEIAEKIRLKL
ncbi:MAG: HIT family protein, partial [Bacteroidia bacterium]|nr:HIT family protein [Bacteroidia bacterium]